MATAAPSIRSKEVMQLVKDAKAGKAKPVYLFAGESFDTRAAAQALLDELVPESKRSFNLETCDGRTTPITTLLDSLRTPGFFAGTKVIWVRESTLFLSGEKRGDLTESLFQDWEAGREPQAAEKLLTLVALSGWTQEQFATANWGAMSDTKLREVFGEALDNEHRAAVEAIRSAALSRDLRVGEYLDESAILLSLLESEMPPNAVLLFTASAVDGRKKLVKRIQEMGGFVALSVERERSGSLARQSIEDLVHQSAAAYGKRVDMKALEQIVRRAGHDTAMLANELEKLCLYVGERDTIREDDVRSIVIDMAESWIFDFTSALAARRAGLALKVLVGLFEQGEPPLRLLAMIAREIRLLLLARECLETQLRSRWRRNMNYNAFQSQVLPHIDEATKRAFGNAHPFVLFRRFEDAAGVSADILREAIVRLSDLDLQLKSSAGDPALLLEVFVLDWCRGFRRRQAQSAVG
jgi:DNA polymerase-3 subunit delta